MALALGNCFLVPAHSSELDKRGLVSFQYSYLDLLIPGKWGLGGQWAFAPGQVWELSYLKGSLSGPWIMEDIGSMSDTRIRLGKRSQRSGSSFNLGLGVAYYDFEVRLGNKLLSSISRDAPNAELIKARSLGAYISVGNRWSLGQSGVIGIDWLVWSQPLIKLEEKSEFFNRVSDEDDEDIVERAIKKVYRFPRIVLLKLELGFRF